MRVVFICTILTIFYINNVYTSRSAEQYMGTNVNVTFDGRSFLINGERELLIGGSVHYPRSTPAHWNAIFERCKEAGIDVIQTYVFWNLHQPTPYSYVFEGNGDITLFLELAMKNKLWVNLRIGPYVCAEWNYGGFPEWLREEREIEFRTMNDTFTNAMATFTTDIVDLLRPFFASRGGPIIMAQVENEYGDIMGWYGEKGREYVKWAIDFAQSLDTGVPWIMCSQPNVTQDVIATCNGFYCEKFIEPHWDQYPNQPAMWTENWPGWFQNWGLPKPTRPVQDIAYAALRWFALGGSYHNYYMWYGGTNFARTSGGPNIVTSYDYDAPLNEYGFPNEPKHSHLSNLHTVIHAYQDLILSQFPPEPIVLVVNRSDAYVYGELPDAVAFLSNYNDTHNVYAEFEGELFYLPAWTVVVLNCSSMTVLYNSSDIEGLPVSERTYEVVPGILNAKEFSWYPEPVGEWTTAFYYQSLPNQLDVSHDTTDYVWYIQTVQVNEGSHLLNVSDALDYSYVYINGTLVLTNEPVYRWETTEAQTIELQILVCTIGLINYGHFLERDRRGILGGVVLDDVNITDNGWTVQVGLYGDFLQLPTVEGSGAVQWNTNVKEALLRPLTWIKYEFDFENITNDVGPFALDLSFMNKGYAYINGQNLGRYFSVIAGQLNCTECVWQGKFEPYNCVVGCGEPSQSYYNVPYDWIQPKNNILVLFEEGENALPTEIEFVRALF